MGKGAQVYLGSAELGGVCAVLGRLPSVQEYLELMPNKLQGKNEQIYSYLNFDKIPDFSL